MIVATWVGGPKDGEEIAVDGDIIRVAFPPKLPISEPSHDLTLNTKDFPVKLTPDGYRIYWTEK